MNTKTLTPELAKKVDQLTERGTDRVVQIVGMLSLALQHGNQERELCLSCDSLSSVRLLQPACRTRPCTLCDTPISSGNTDVPKVCSDCARNYQLCTRCGADKNQVKAKLQQTVRQLESALKQFNSTSQPLPLLDDEMAELSSDKSA